MSVKICKGFLLEKRDGLVGTEEDVPMEPVVKSVRGKDYDYFTFVGLGNQKFVLIVRR